MSSALSTPAQRAQLRIAGPQTYPILIAAPGNQTYTLDPGVPGYFQVLSATLVTASGTITVAVNRVRAGVTTAVGGLSALAASNVAATTASSLNDTSLFQPGDQLQIVGSANAAGADLAVSVKVQPMGYSG